MTGFLRRQVRPQTSHLVRSVKSDRADLRLGYAENPRPAQQRALSNQAAQRFAESCPLRLPSPSLCPYGGACHTCPAPVQTKLTINKPGDKYEQEANRVADAVMRMPEPYTHVQRACPTCDEEETAQPKPLAEQITPLIQKQAEPEEEEEEPVQTKLTEGTQVQRQEEEPEEEEEETAQAKLAGGAQVQRQEEEEGPVQTKSADGTVLQRQEEEPEEEEEEPVQTKQASGRTLKVGSGLQAQIRSLSGGGQPLSRSVRNFFETRFEYDFSQVRVHADARAAKLARAMNARAFTRGRDMVFAPDQYAPRASAGKRLLAHELTHTVQQQAAQPIIQRQPQKPRWVGQSAFDELNRQIKIIWEPDIPWHLKWKPGTYLARSAREIEQIRARRKEQAATKLGELGLKRGVITLIAILRDGKDGIPAVNRLSPRHKALVRKAAAEALGRIGGKRATLELRSALHSTNASKRKLAIRGFTRMKGRPAALALLTRLNKESDRFVKYLIVVALGKIGNGLSSGHGKKLIVKELIQTLKRSTGVVMNAAVEALGIIKDRSATEPLLKELRLWATTSIAETIVRALGRIGDKRAIAYLIIMLKKHPRSTVRCAAAEALGRIGAERALRKALRSKRERDLNVRRAILYALARLLIDKETKRLHRK